MNNEEKEYLMKFAERLKSVRLKNNITQEILAEKLNVSVQLRQYRTIDKEEK